MLRYTFDVEIKMPLDKVVQLFVNRELFPRWQPGLISDEVIKSKDDKRKYRLTFQVGKRKLVLDETILTDELPARYDIMYGMKGVTNIVNNTFTSMDESTTKWISKTEFTFKGMMMFIGPFMKKGFEQQSKMIMRNFKMFAEKRTN